MKPAKQPKKNNKQVTLILFLVFIAPVALAGILLKTDTWKLNGTHNHGTLIAPPIAIGNWLEPTIHSKSSKLAKKETERKTWKLILITQTDCDASCKNALMLMRQTHTALGPNQHRVSRLLMHQKPLTPTATQLIQTTFPKMNVLNFTTESPLESLQSTNMHTSATVYVVDPLGYALLSFAVGPDQQKTIIEGKGLLKDLKKLLKLSRVG